MLYIKFVTVRQTMKKVFQYFLLFLLVSCSSGHNQNKKDVITVSISPFRYFVKAIAGDDFDVNVMVPVSADPHVYEPAPNQITALSNSVAFISDGYLDFEITWLDRFFETNRKMKKVSLAEGIDLLKAEENHSHGNIGADPHFWVSPKAAYPMALTVKSLLVSLRPENTEKYEKNFKALCDTIAMLDKKAVDLFSDHHDKPFMIFHPALAYIARDYHIVELAVEREGKEPSPSSMKALIDEARSKKIKIILIQKGFDTKNAGAIADETGATLRAIDPLGENWPAEVSDILDALHESLEKSSK
jgi:zinc transport system substrate-binding protein